MNVPQRMAPTGEPVGTEQVGLEDAAELGNPSVMPSRSRRLVPGEGSPATVAPSTQMVDLQEETE
jgi:hypothetical protein